MLDILKRAPLSAEKLRQCVWWNHLHAWLITSWCKHMTDHEFIWYYLHPLNTTDTKQSGIILYGHKSIRMSQIQIFLFGCFVSLVFTLIFMVSTFQKMFMLKAHYHVGPWVHSREHRFFFAHVTDFFNFLSAFLWQLWNIALITIKSLYNVTFILAA